MENINLAKKHITHERAEAWILNCVHANECEIDGVNFVNFADNDVLVGNCIFCGEVGMLENEVECECKHMMPSNGHNTWMR